MKSFMKKICSMILAASMIASVASLVACQKDDSEGDGNMLKINDSYTIVTGAELDTVASTAAQTLADALNQEKIATEIKKDSETEKGKFEILVGQTNREESTAAYEKLEAIDDFVVNAINENVIVICGKTPIATEKAVEYFLKEYVHAGTDEFDGKLFVSGESIFRREYDYESVKLEDIAIKDYVVAIKDDSFMRAAYELAHALGNFSGELVKIVKYDELTADNKGVICLGSNGRNPATPNPQGLIGYFLNLETDEQGATISVVWTQQKYFEEAIAKFAERFAVSGTEKDGDGRFTSVTQHAHKGLNAVNSAEWVVESKIERQVTKGLTQVSYTCRGFKNLPYLVHVMTVDLDYVDLMLGTADNRNDVEDKWVQTPAEHARAAEKQMGVTVFGAINAGYPTGISVKEGRLMVKGTIHRPYFALLKTGEPVILYDDNAADVSKIEMAACGTHVIVDNYMPGELAMNEDFSYTTHPRTLLGIRGDGKVVMVVIDGRQPELSNGSPMVRSADIMMKLGCKIAINFDGGGSSAMFVRETNGAYRIVNKISDPVMRRVRNSILVINKDEK